ncbi:hypothetical protein AAG570_010644 [Ranatra chinensis]|uniref:Uncharacterized protein n=1 Tax=Ranatra chinensis TaxID=642074 RepID=A0ABD0YN91_9HEMI
MAGRVVEDSVLTGELGWKKGLERNLRSPRGWTDPERDPHGNTNKPGAEVNPTAGGLLNVSTSVPQDKPSATKFIISGCFSSGQGNRDNDTCLFPSPPASCSRRTCFGAWTRSRSRSERQNTFYEIKKRETTEIAFNNLQSISEFAEFLDNSCPDAISSTTGVNPRAGRTSIEHREGRGGLETERYGGLRLKGIEDFKLKDIEDFKLKDIEDFRLKGMEDFRLKGMEDLRLKELRHTPIDSRLPRVEQWLGDGLQELGYPSLKLRRISIDFYLFIETSGCIIAVNGSRLPHHSRPKAAQMTAVKETSVAIILFLSTPTGTTLAKGQYINRKITSIPWKRDKNMSYSQGRAKRRNMFRNDSKQETTERYLAICSVGQYFCEPPLTPSPIILFVPRMRNCIKSPLRSQNAMGP